MGRLLMSDTGNGTLIPMFSNFTVEATATPPSHNLTSQEPSVRRGASFNPFLAIAVSGMVISFFAVGFASGYLRRWIWGYDDEARHRELLHRSHHLNRLQNQSKAKQRGLDPEVVAAIPLVRYKDLPPADEKSFDCPVCLATFDPTDDLKLLPHCNHAFHSDCIDEWFRSHSTCPLCRISLAAHSKSDTQGDRHSAPANINHPEGQGNRIAANFDVDTISQLQSHADQLGPSDPTTTTTTEVEAVTPRSILCRKAGFPSFFVPAIRVDVVNAKAVVSSIRRSNSVGTYRPHAGYVVDSEGTQHGHFQVAIDDQGAISNKVLPCSRRS